VQQSSDLETWKDVDLTTQTQVLNALAGTRTFTVTLPQGTTGFARVTVVQR
jgi:hypothetical protein